MKEIKGEDGIVLVRITCFPEDGRAWGLAVSWAEGDRGLPATRDWEEAIDSCLVECRDLGAAAVDSRVITANEGVAQAVAASRAAMHRTSLAARGFRQGEGRLEYRLALDEAILGLEKADRPRRLAWASIDAGNEASLAETAALLREAAAGDPAYRPDDDVRGLIDTFLADEKTVPLPERLQLGSLDGVPAVVLALNVHRDGWSSIYYLGVLPAFRGRGLGSEAMLHGLRCLKAMGGRTYHDGTGSRNASTLGLLAKLGKPPFRAMEEWRLELRSGV